LLCERILTRLNRTLSAEKLQLLRSEHAYNGFIAALEELRSLLGEEKAEDYYLRLLATPLRERPSLLLGKAGFLQGEPRRQFKQ